MTGIGIEAMEHEGAGIYLPLSADHPPFATHLVVCDQWWGCPEWLIRGACDLPDRFSPTRNTSVGAMVAKALEAPQQPTQIGPARFRPNRRGVALPIQADTRFAVDLHYFAYVGAMAEVEEWRWLSPLALKSRPDGGVLGGFCKDLLVGIVAPVWMGSLAARRLESELNRIEGRD